MTIPFPPAGVQVHSVGEITRTVKALIEGAYSSGVWVAGEASNLARPSSGHVYLTLKDNAAQLRCVMYRSAASRMKFELCDGLEVIARGRLTVYTPRGEYQLQIEELQPKGMGALELAFRQLKEKLSVQGYFDPRRKRPLPRFPRRLAVITSPTGAAVRDMLEILYRRWPALEVWVCPVRVQGEGSAQEIAAAIRRLNALPGIDVLVVGRGGGSLEDLWAFNEECVAQAIFQSRIPVVSGVGHETDLVISDLVADCRALTPSDAAVRVVPDRVELLEALTGLEVRLRNLLLKKLEWARGRLNDLSSRRSFRFPWDRIREEERRLDEWNERLQRGLQQRLFRARQHLESQAARLGSLSPLNVLARGYSLTRNIADQALIRSPDQVQPGDRLESLVQHGRIVSRVEDASHGYPAS